MTPREAAKLIGCSASHIHYLCQRGRIKARKKSTLLVAAGYTWHITQAEARRYRDKKQTRGFPRGQKRN